VTVIAPHATAAEVFAKVLLIGGLREAERIAAWHNDLALSPWIASANCVARITPRSCWMLQQSNTPENDWISVRLLFILTGVLWG